ncbi:response regulator [Paenibacillus puldeungensis]|uniref:Response regulator n=1 Tax=Paenibacillus puldeungensis TaxID=696536 RepID=A0ABW3S4M7_9BACL
MLHLLIIDDEPGHVIGFSRLLSRLRPCDTVSSARSGEEALRLCENQAFDLIFTDIQMPEMNGLEFMEKLSSPARSKVVVLSGYDFFEYAQKALTFGAFDYLLKPVDVDRLQELFRRAEQTSEQERNDWTKQQELAAKITRMEPVYSGKLLQAWIDGVLEVDQLNEVESILCFGGAGTAISVHRRFSFQREEADKLQSLLCLFGKAVCIINDHDNEEIICLLEAGVDMTEAERVFESFSWHSESSKGRCVVGVGSDRVHLLKEACVSIREARLAMLEHFYEEEKAVFLFGRSKLDPERVPAMSGAVVSQLAEAVRGGDDAAARDALASIFSSWRRAPYALPHRLRTKCKLLLVKLIEDIELLREGSMHDDFVREIEAFSDHVPTFSQLESGTLDILLRASRAIKEWKDHSRNQLVQRCLDYIEEQYRYDISLESTAERFGLSAGYFSQYFKNKLNINFTAYLNQVRLSKAKAILELENLRVYEVAEAVGYQDVKYFNRVFKKEFGMTPEEYRKTIRLLQRKRG